MRAITFDLPRRARRAAIAQWLLSLLAVLAWPTAARSAGPPAVGQPAPALIARTFDGRTIDIATLRGKLIVLNFWASWCGPCRSEMPSLDALARDYRDRGVVVVGLSADDPHDRKDALAAARSLSYQTGMLSEATTNGFADPPVLPLTYIIGVDGKVLQVLLANRGPLSATQLRAAVEAHLLRDAGTAGNAGR